jgi:hypothetical protein
MNCEDRSHHDWDYKVDDKVLLQKMVYYANQRVGKNVILGLSYQFIRMGQSGFNVEQSQNDLTLGELHLFYQSDLTVINVIFYWIISLSYTAIMLYVHHDNLS